jgi:hypothetical protein
VSAIALCALRQKGAEVANELGQGNLTEADGSVLLTSSLR